MGGPDPLWEGALLRGTYTGHCNVPIRIINSHCSSAAAGECACSAYAADECIRHRRGDKTFCQIILDTCFQCQPE